MWRFSLASSIAMLLRTVTETCGVRPTDWLSPSNFITLRKKRMVCTTRQQETRNCQGIRWIHHWLWNREFSEKHWPNNKPGPYWEKLSHYISPTMGVYWAVVTFPTGRIPIIFRQVSLEKVSLENWIRVKVGWLCPRSVVLIEFLWDNPISWLHDWH